MKGKKRTAADRSAPLLDLPQLEQILAFMAEHGLEEFEYCRGDLRIRLKKASSNSAPNYSHSVQPENPLPPVSATAVGEAKALATQSMAGEEALIEEHHMVKSPIVGTFYGAPSPDADPFVRVGDSVKAGQILCIIEAMKLMNEIESDVAGEITRILVKNGQPVEYGESLFAIRSTQGK